MSGAIVDRGMTPVDQPIVRRVSMAKAARFLVCVVLLVFAAANVHAQSLLGVPNTKRKVIDTGLESLADRIAFSNPIRWLDDHTLTFNPLQAGPDSKLKKAIRGVLYDTRTRSYITIVENGFVTCVVGDLIVFRDTAKENQAEYARASADRRTVQSAGYPTPGVSRDPYTCKPREQTIGKGRLISLLRPADGYIDRGKVGGGAVEQAVLYRPGKPPLELPLKGHEIRDGRFVPFLDKYYIGHWRLLSPDGTISELARPRPVVNGVPLGPTGIVRGGVVSLGGTAERGDRGLYLATDDTVERLVFGWIPVVSVSPNGCRVAFVSGPGYYFEDRNTLKYVNVCDEA